MEENLDEFDYMIINVEYLLNGSLNNKALLKLDFLLSDNQSAQMSLTNGAYFFIKTHIYAHQITYFVIMDGGFYQTDLITTTPNSDVVISNDNGIVNFKSNGMCCGIIILINAY